MTDPWVKASGHGAGIRASDLIAAQVKQLRARRGLTVKELASRCAELGGGDLTVNVLTNIEVRRRDVSADELLLLALALDVAPTHLLAPPPRRHGRPRGHHRRRRGAEGRGVVGTRRRRTTAMQRRGLPRVRRGTGRAHGPWHERPRRRTAPGPRGGPRDAVRGRGPAIPR